jgi:hypothetical protein
MLFVVLVFCAKAKIGPEWWALYMKKDGRFTFQIDLAQALINYAIENEWEDLDGPRPNWMRQTNFVQLFLLLEILLERREQWNCTQEVEVNSHNLCPTRQQPNLVQRLY